MSFERKAYGYRIFLAIVIADFRDFRGGGVSLSHSYDEYPILHSTSTAATASAAAIPIITASFFVTATPLSFPFVFSLLNLSRFFPFVKQSEYKPAYNRPCGIQRHIIDIRSSRHISKSPHSFTILHHFNQN